MSQELLPLDLPLDTQQREKDQAMSLRTEHVCDVTNLAASDAAKKMLAGMREMIAEQYERAKDLGVPDTKIADKLKTERLRVWAHVLQLLDEVVVVSGGPDDRK